MQARDVCTSQGGALEVTDCNISRLVMRVFLAEKTTVCTSQGGALEVADCDISSATGSGIGVEGGELTLARSAVHDCARHGIALFTDLEGQGGKMLVTIAGAP